MLPFWVLMLKVDLVSCDFLFRNVFTLWLIVILEMIFMLKIKMFFFYNNNYHWFAGILKEVNLV